jgi:hypothetical protein
MGAGRAQQEGGGDSCSKRGQEERSVEGAAAPASPRGWWSFPTRPTTRTPTCARARARPLAAGARARGNHGADAADADARCRPLPLRCPPPRRALLPWGSRSSLSSPKITGCRHRHVSRVHPVRDHAAHHRQGEGRWLSCLVWSVPAAGRPPSIARARKLTPALATETIATPTHTQHHSCAPEERRLAREAVAAVDR